jgi:hypothetical protein
MAYHFHVDAIDSTGHRASGPQSWEITFRGGAMALRTLVSLSANDFDLNLPRPLGIRLEQADSIEIVGTWGDSTTSGITLLVTIDFDPMDRAASRLAVVPVGASAASPAGAMVQQWSFTTAQNGRLLAITGLPVDSLVSITLQDVETGATLWSAVIASTFGGPRGVARLGVALQGGRQYRIIVTYTAGHAAGERTIVGMVLPTR